MYGWNSDKSNWRVRFSSLLPPGDFKSSIFKGDPLRLVSATVLLAESCTLRSHKFF